MRKVRSVISFLLLVVVVFLVATFTTHFGIFPYPMIRDTTRGVVVWLAGDAPAKSAAPAAPSAPAEIDSIFLRLAVDRYQVSPAREGAGGGLTSFGDALIVMPHDGRLFSFDDDELNLLSIRVPDNGMEALKARAATDEYASLQFDFTKFRYNDILYYSENASHGLVVSFTEWHDAERCYGNTIAHLPLPVGLDDLSAYSAGAADWEIAYRTQPCLLIEENFRPIQGHMAGGRIAYSGGGRVVLASGDYAIDGVYAEERLARQLDNDYGKVIEIDLAAKTAHRVSRGHSNTQGIAVDAAGTIWAVEHGRRGGDELNRIVEGADYGWPEATFGTRYNRLPWPGSSPYGRHDGYALPTFAWLPSVAISSLTVLDGMHPAWDGDLMAGSLVGTSLYRIRVQEGRAIFTEQIRVGSRIRAVHQHTNGRLALWTDDRQLLILTVSDRGLVFDHINDIVASLDGEEATKTAIAGQIDACAECHSFDLIATETAPALGQVFGHAVAGGEFQGYSEGLRARGGQWTSETLAAFLDDPEGWAPGTTMPDPNMTDPAVLAGVVEVLRRVEADPE